MLNLSDFDYHVPDTLIAQTPADQRQEAKFLVSNQNGQIVHTKFSLISEHIPSDAVIVVNNSKVIAGRLLGHLSTGAKIEIFLIRPDGENEWIALGRPLKKLKIGTVIDFDEKISAQVNSKHISSDDSQFIKIQFNVGPTELLAWIEEFGFIPLPPYIKRDSPRTAALSPDKERYQTVYAQTQGSVAAPTAGLHFTKEIIASLESKGVQIAPVCLHVGAGTFLPVKSENIDKHHMHEELYMIPKETIKAILNAKEEDRPVIVVGTTSLRSLESLALLAGGDQSRLEELSDIWHSTKLFVRPKEDGDIYKPFAISGIITNFHQPKSTLFMLICALIGRQNAKRLYKTAVEHGYRFFSYGDSTLLWL